MDTHHVDFHAHVPEPGWDPAPFTISSSMFDTVDDVNGLVVAVNEAYAPMKSGDHSKFFREVRYLAGKETDVALGKLLRITPGDARRTVFVMGWKAMFDEPVVVMYHSGYATPDWRALVLRGPRGVGSSVLGTRLVRRIASAVPSDLRCVICMSPVGYIPEDDTKGDTFGFETIKRLSLTTSLLLPEAEV